MTRRHSTFVVALCAALAACGGGSAATTTIAATTTTAASTTTTTEAGFEVTSEDGSFTVTVPASAAAADPGIAITRLEIADYPSGLGGVADDPTFRVYDLGPDGLEFTGPVTVALRIDAAEFTDLAPNEVPVLVMFTTDAAGGFVPLDDLEVTRRGAEVLVSGTTIHFSPVLVAREATTVTTSVNAEELENVASARSLDGILQLMTEAPGVIPVSAGVRDSSGTSITGIQPNLIIDGLPGTAGDPFIISCDDITEVDVLKVINTVEFGSDSIAGVVDLIVTGELFPAANFNINLTLSARARCFDPAGSILLTELSGFEVTTDHPGEQVFIPDENFLGGLSGLLARWAEQSRFVGLYGGLICDNDGNGQVDATDTMFPVFPLTSVGNRYELVAPLFNFADYFIYFVDESQFSGLPAGSGWTVEQGLIGYESMFNGSGRFESSLGVVEVDGTPFVYNVGPTEGSTAVPGAQMGLFESMRIRY